MFARVESRLRPGAILAIAVLTTAACGEGGVASSPQLPPATSATGAAAPTTPPDPTPMSTVIDGASVTTVSLGPNRAPIDVVAGFGSLWVANHRAASVSRIDPATFEEIATITVGAGPGWFAVTEDAVWVTNQLGRGLSRIDPATNTSDDRAGSWAPCGGPVVAKGFIWQLSCDAGIIMRIDPATNASTDIYADDYQGVAVFGDDVIAISEEAISRLDTATDDLERLGGGFPGFMIGYDSSAMWLVTPDGLNRVAVDDAAVLATVPLSGDLVMTMAGDHAWLTSFGGSLYEVDVDSGSLLRTLRLEMPAVAREIDGVVWVTSFDANSLSRFEP